MTEEENQDLPYQDYIDLEGYLSGEQDVADEESEKPFSYFDLLDAPRYLPDPVDLTLDHLKDIAHELGIIELCWPEIVDPYFEERTSFPKSYTQNSEKEKVLLLYTENFRRQFTYKYPNRKPLFLACENECGMQKMVCTTIRPTTLPYPELETWEDCARCVADLVRYEVFEDYPTLLNVLNGIPRDIVIVIFQKRTHELNKLYSRLFLTLQTLIPNFFACNINLFFGGVHYHYRDPELQ